MDGKTSFSANQYPGALKPIHMGYSTHPVIDALLRLHSCVAGLFGMQPRSSTVTHSAPRKVSTHGIYNNDSRRTHLMDSALRRQTDFKSLLHLLIIKLVHQRQPASSWFVTKSGGSSGPQT